MSLNSSEGPADRPGSGSDTEEACPFDDNHSLLTMMMIYSIYNADAYALCFCVTKKPLLPAIDDFFYRSVCLTQIILTYFVSDEK